MPKFLLLCTVTSFAAIFLIIPLLKQSEQPSFNGVRITQEEFWKLGIGPFYILAATVLPVAGYAFLRHRGWGRIIFIGFMICQFVWILIAGHFSPLFEIDGIYIVQCCAFIAFLVWYLYFKMNVLEYFRQDSGNDEPAAGALRRRNGETQR